MPSSFDTEFASEVVPDLFSEFAEIITRYPNGSGAGVSITAIVTLEDGAIETKAGETHIHKGYCDVLEATTLDVKDSFLIRGKNVQVTRIREAISGVKRFWFKRTSHESRTHGYGDVL